MLLNIPPQKTLLRRHLTTKFNALIGPEAEQEKRDKMASPAYTPLTTTAKVRVRYQSVWVPAACRLFLMLNICSFDAWAKPMSAALHEGCAWLVL